MDDSSEGVLSRRTQLEHRHLPRVSGGTNVLAAEMGTRGKVRGLCGFELHTCISRQVHQAIYSAHECSEERTSLLTYPNVQE